jgi:hypothetical protein
MRHAFHKMPWTKPVLLALAMLAFGVAPYLTEPFTGYDPGQFPVQIARPSIQPAGYAFAIWGVIYLWLAAHALFGVIARHADPDWDRVRTPLTISLTLGAVWLAIANEAPLSATIGIWIMQATALTAFLRADPARDRWLLIAPLAIYAGWLTAAAAVSTGVVVAGYGMLTDTAAALAMLALALGIATVTQSLQRTMPLYTLTVIWALGGIIAANWTPNPTITYAAVGGAVYLATSLLISAKRR